MRSRVILEEALGQEHPEVATMLYNFAGFFEAQVRDFPNLFHGDSENSWEVVSPQLELQEFELPSNLTCKG